jgi:hypothetical protein
MATPPSASEVTRTCRLPHSISRSGRCCNFLSLLVIIFHAPRTPLGQISPLFPSSRKSHAWCERFNVSIPLAVCLSSSTVVQPIAHSRVMRILCHVPPRRTRHRSASQLRPKCAGIEDDRALRKSPAAAWRFHGKRFNKNCDWASHCRTDCPRAEPHTAPPHPSRCRGPRRRSRRTASGHFSLTTKCRRRYSRAARPATLSGRRDTKGRGAPLDRLDRGGA